MRTDKEEERRLVELFEAASKAAAAAEVRGDEEGRCLDALSQLKAFPVTVQLLASTQVGKHLQPLTKHRRINIQILASEIVMMWKKIVLEQTMGDGVVEDINSVETQPPITRNANSVAEKLQGTNLTDSISKEMATDEGQSSNKKLVITDCFRCSRCGSRRMALPFCGTNTITVVCTNCNNRAVFN